MTWADSRVARWMTKLQRATPHSRDQTKLSDELERHRHAAQVPPPPPRPRPSPGGRQSVGPTRPVARGRLTDVSRHITRVSLGLPMADPHFPGTSTCPTSSSRNLAFERPPSWPRKYARADPTAEQALGSRGVELTYDREMRHGVRCRRWRRAWRRAMSWPPARWAR
jgi:hypothetical protein